MIFAPHYSLEYSLENKTDTVENTKEINPKEAADIKSEEIALPDTTKTLEIKKEPAKKQNTGNFYLAVFGTQFSKLLGGFLGVVAGIAIIAAAGGLIMFAAKAAGMSIKFGS